MDEVYRRMKWLDINQATDWLQRLTGNPLTTNDLLSLCDSKQCSVYADTCGLHGVDINSPVCEKISGADIQKVLTPMYLKFSGQEIVLELGFERPAYSYTFRGVKYESKLTEWVAKSQLRNIEALFKPDDILALASGLKPDDDSQPNQSKLDSLHQELGLERAKRKVAEAEIEKLRQRINDTCTYLRPDLSCDICTLTSDCSNVQATNQHGVTPPDLVFPYETKRLEAMRAAAVKHWANYTPDKRRPTQKEIGLDLGEALGLPRQSNGEPAREAKVLAVAIKPDFEV